MSGVVMLVNEFPPLPVGGAETQAERLATYLARRGWSVWVVTRGANGLQAHEERNGFQIIRPRTLGSGKLRTLTFMLFALLALFQMRRQYGILHAHLAFGPAFVATLLGRLLGKRTLVKFGGSGTIGDVSISRATWRGRLRLGAIRRWTDVVIVLTDAMRAEALSVGIPVERVRTFNNGIETGAFQATRPKQEAKRELSLDDRTVVLFIGRLDPVKSLDTILDALPLALNRCPALHLMIVGDGPERAPLEARAEALGIRNRISFMGSQKNVRPYLEAADLFILPSLTEGISNALLEAMASRLACLATPVGGNVEVLSGGKFGMMVPVRDVSAWADALATVGGNPEARRQLGDAAYQRILSTYDFEVVGAQYEELYMQLLKNEKRILRMDGISNDG